MVASAAPDYSLAERLKYSLVPPSLYIRWLHGRAIRKGEPELRLLDTLANPDRLSLDVGANKGVYSYALLRCSRAVCAFEPNPKCFGVLESWARDKVRLFPIALSDRNGRADLNIPRSARGYSNQGATLLPIRNREFRSMPVEVRRLDDLGLDDVGFIKIDVEGGEQEVLAGGAELLRRCRPRLLVEIEEKHSGRPLAELLAAICAYGYRAHVLKRGGLEPFAPPDRERLVSPAARADYVFNFVFLPEH